MNHVSNSNYDAFGNARFIDSLEPYGFPRMKDSIFNEEFNWGFTNYDNFAFAFVTTFQVITLEGWSDIMARVIDAWSTGPAIISFTLLIVVGGIIALNIVLAVISGSLDKIENDMAKEDEMPLSACNTENTDTKGRRESIFRRSRDRMGTIANILIPKNSALRRKSKWILRSRLYSRSILAAILLNTIILSCDHYGISPEFQMVLDSGNFITTMIFFVDMLISNVAYGGEYWR